jgi:D-alanyl-D-alanine carboxypeptidase
VHIRWAVVAVLAVLAGCGNDPVPPARSAVAPGTLAPSTLAGSASAPASSAAAQPAAAQPAANPLVIPAGVTAGIVVFDRQTGGFTYEQNAAMRFRSASLVKLLIVLDHLWGSSDVPAGDRARLDLMLRASDDAAATYFWRRNGSRAVVTRMAARL